MASRGIDVQMKRMMRQRVYKACKSRGLTLQRAAYKGLQSVLAQYVRRLVDHAVYRSDPSPVPPVVCLYVNGVHTCVCVCARRIVFGGFREPDLEAGVAVLLDHLQEHLERHGGT